MTTTPTISESRKAALERELREMEAAERERRHAAVHAANAALELAQIRRGKLEESLKQADLARDEREKRDLWNSLLESWRDPSTHWHPPAAVRSGGPTPQEQETITAGYLAAQEKDRQRLEELNAAKRAYERAALRRVEAEAGFEKHEVHEQIRHFERAREAALSELRTTAQP